MQRERFVTLDEALEWKRLYEQQKMPILDLALEVGRSPSTVRKWLHLVDTQMRPAFPVTVGDRKPKPKPKPKDGVIHAAGRHSHTGHRRRGWR